MRIFLLFMVVVFPLSASTYYIDFDGGSDSNDGSLANPWKHCKGDPNATGNAAGATFAAGDMIAFKGGVTYRGRVALPAAGTVASPTLYSGDTWGTGKSVIDGSDILTNWVACTQQSDFPPNTNWPNIFYTKIPVLPRWVTNQHATAINLWQSNLPLVAAQWPLSTNALYQTPWAYLTPESANTTTITDADLATFGDIELTNSLVYGFEQPNNNELYLRRITAYDAAAKKITFPAMGIAPQKYALVNVSTGTVFNAEGQYYFDRTTSNLFVWPRGGANLAVDNCVTWSWQPYGFHASESIPASNIWISGFIVQKQTGDDANDSMFGRTGCAIKKASSGALKGITITNCEIRWTYQEGDAATILFEPCTDFTFISNYVHDTRGRGRGLTYGAAAGCTIQGNIFSNICRTVIYTEMATNVTVKANRIVDSYAIHGNGISCYQYTDTATIMDNWIVNAGIGISSQLAGNLKVINNLIDAAWNDPTKAQYCYGGWGQGWGTNWFLSNTFINSANLALYWSAVSDAALTKYVLINNITDGIAVTDAAANSVTNDHNLFTQTTWSYASSYTPGSGDATQTDLSIIFSDSPAKVYNLKSGSPAINMGADLTAYGYSTDIIGNSRDATWDIGAYEYVPAGPTYLRVTGSVRAGTIRMR